MKTQLELINTNLKKYTFQSPKIKKWVEDNSHGLVLNLFAGPTKLNLNEIRTIRMILDPVLGKKRLEKERKREEELEAYRKLSIEERRQLRIKEIRDSRQKKAEKRRYKIDKKFQNIIDKEQYGKKGFRKLKQEEEPDIKDKKIKKDEYDFT